MSKINVDTWEPESGTAATLMASGDTVTVPSGAELDIASGATLDVNGTIDLTGATKTGFPSAGFNTVTAFTVSSSGWSPASGTTQIIVEIQAGGGGGGGAGSASTGGHAGGGAFAWKRLTVVDTDTMDIVVGAAGTAGAYGGAGGAGGTSSFTSASGTSFTAITCVGGAAGSGGGGSTNGAGGAGGTVTSAGGSYDFRMDGANGRSDALTTGGGSFWGLGQVGVSGEGNGTLGVGYGSGGQGPTKATSSYSSVVGQIGLVVIWEYK